ncbi:phage holin [Agathobaculum sp. NTUH-O15-33]|uniref:phage holin n=1 Tax=Agathobaculum sp. NTUH-O15-33 TaxID=3079302 RepID=UPI0029586C4A|nr:phage holin [Agathobaculum sp. NTUH-O15-33]WNX85268.1 phage holin [Agathobaculum sp. NTUH-O15-33]
MNIKVRIKNPVFWVQILGGVLLTALGYNAMQPQDLTTWAGLWELLKGVALNPYLLGLCVWNAWSALNDPTTSGVTDSDRAKGYDKPLER